MTPCRCASTHCKAAPRGLQCYPSNPFYDPMPAAFTLHSHSIQHLRSNFIHNRELVALIFHSTFSSHLNNYQFYCLIKGRVKISNQFRRASKAAEKTVDKQKGQHCLWPREMMSCWIWQCWIADIRGAQYDMISANSNCIDAEYERPMLLIIEYPKREHSTWRIFSTNPQECLLLKD